MKASTVIAVLAASVVSAQIEQLPQCALQCALTSLGSTGCPTTDFKCICSATSFIAGLTPCVQTACTPAEYAKTLQVASGLCASAGVTLSVPSSASATSAAASASSAASSILSYASSSAASSSSAVYSSISSIASSLSSVYANATITTHVPVPTGNATITGGGSSPTGTTTLPAAPSQSDSAAGRNAVALGGLGVAAVAFAAALL